MKTSLILSTYNWPEALRCCLESIARQERLPDEILIADDGSRDETRRLIEAFAASSGLPLRHIWHEDRGFRLAAIRNRAMAAATGDYLIQIDGDLVLHPRFVADHIAMARQGFYVVGSRVVLGPTLSRKLLDHPSQAAFPGLFEHDLKNRLNGIRLPLLTRLLQNRRGHGARGCNMAFWREDVLAVNGYDEQMTGWGHEDKEFAARLGHLGRQQHSLKFGGLAAHLWHNEASRSRETVNLDILHRTEREKTIRCETGIAQYL